MRRLFPYAIGALLAAAVLLGGPVLEAQLQQSGGPGSSVTTQLGSVVKTDQTTHGTTDLVASDQIKVAGTTIATGNGIAGTGVQRVTIASDNSAISTTISSLPALVAGTAIVGFVRTLPAGCTQTTRFSGDTVGVAVTTGTTVTASTTCIASVYVNNITNSAVTLRLADKQGSPVIWVGGNNDFSVPANSNLGLPFLAGVTFTSGITAIAGTGSALNLHVEGWQ